MDVFCLIHLSEVTLSQATDETIFAKLLPHSLTHSSLSFPIRKNSEALGEQSISMFSSDDAHRTCRRPFLEFEIIDSIIIQIDLTLPIALGSTRIGVTRSVLHLFKLSSSLRSQRNKAGS